MANCSIIPIPRYLLTLTAEPDGVAIPPNSSGTIFIEGGGGITVTGTLASNLITITGSGGSGITFFANDGTSSTADSSGQYSLLGTGILTTTAGVNSMDFGFTGLTQYGILYATSTTTLATTAALTNGQLLIGSTGAAPVLTTLTAGSGITIANGSGSITISSTSSSSTTFDGDSGSATPSSDILNIIGEHVSGAGLFSTASGNTVSVGFVGLTQYGIVYADSTTTISTTAALTSGQVLFGSATVPLPITLTFDASSGSAVFDSSGTISFIGAGTVTTSAVGNTVTITGSGSSSFAWTVITIDQSAVVDNGYITNSNAALTVTLPDAAAVGDVVWVVGQGSGGWVIQTGSGQAIYFGSVTSSSNGTLFSSNQYDSAQLLCVQANSFWSVVSCQGNIGVT